MEKLKFYSRRDFSERLNFIFDFIKQNYQPLLKGSIYIGIILFLTNIISFATMPSLGQSFSAQSSLSSFMSLIQNIALIFYILYIYTYIAEYIKGEGFPQIENLWNRSMGYFGKFFGTSLLVGVVVVIAIIPIVVIALLNGLSTIIFNGLTPENIVSMIGSLFLVILIVAIPLTWFLFAISLYGPVILTDNTSGIAALKESMRLVRNNWWRTFGFLLICSLLSGVVTLVLSIPVLITSTIIMLNQSTFGIILTSILSIFSVVGTIISTILGTIATYALYGEYREEKDGVDMDSQIEKIGENRL